MNNQQESWMKGHNEAWRLANIEIERLKKENELQYWKGYDNGMLAKHGRAEHVGYQEGLVEGERRAMQRVKETILRLDKQFSKGAFQPTLRSLYRELGLGEEEKK